MKITRTSPFSGETNTLEIAVTEAQFSDWKRGELIQNAMPNLTNDEREFIMTGITAKEWKDTFGGEEY
jgi:hypothetical protein